VNMSIKVAICCDVHLFGEGLKRLLEEDHGIEVIGCLNDYAKLIEIAKLHPDVILIDFSTDQDIISLLSEFPEEFLFAQEAKILLLCDRTIHLLPDMRLTELFEKGVVGFLPSSTDAGLLKKAIKSISSGELWIDRKTLKNILFSRGNLEKISLTGKEREIVSLICRGYRNKEIAVKLDISEQTVKSHCNHIYKKLGVSDRLNLALYSKSLSASSKSRSNLKL
jgi:DNA-binding NarL/FixJ family response regulator